MVQKLRLAAHSEADAYWSGGEYELNLTFGTLRDKQWQRVLETIWNHEAVAGPFRRRYSPGDALDRVPILVPAPTDAQAQYGSLRVGSLCVGCGVLATRSLFECVTLQVPLGMFDGLHADPPASSRFHIDALDRLYQDIALAVYEAVPFDLANIGFQCECRLVAELQTDSCQRRAFLAGGYFFARDTVLASLNVRPDDYPLALPGLHWVPPED